jgi:predicted alpha/beta-hydrolase family hydrolase
VPRRESQIEPTARFEKVEIPLGEPVYGLESVPATLGVPEWWPTGSRVSVIIAHGSQKEDPLLQFLQEQLTERKLLTLRFHFPFVEAGKKRPDSQAVMLRVFRAAIGLLARDPTAAPAHVFLGGKNVGALAAAHAGTARLRLDGLFLLGFPLHKQGDTSKLRTERLFRVVSPILFATGTRDRNCELDVLRRIVLRIGAPTAIHAVEEADQGFKVTKKSTRTQEEVDREILGTVEAWIRKILGE